MNVVTRSVPRQKITDFQTSSSILMVMGVTHKEGYKDLGVVTVLFPIVATVTIILLAMMGVR